MFTNLVFVYPGNVQLSVTKREKRNFLQRLSYRCEIIRKFFNTAVRRKATATGIAESTNVVSGIIRCKYCAGNLRQSGQP